MKSTSRAIGKSTRTRDFQSGGGESLDRGGELDFPLARRPQDGQGAALIGLAFAGLESLGAHDVPAVEADDFSWAGDGEPDGIGGVRDERAVFIEELDLHIRNVVEIRGERFAVRDEDDFRGLASGAEEVGSDFPVVVSGDGLEAARLIGGLPVERAAVLAGGFFAEGLVVEKKFDLIGVAVDFHVLFMGGGVDGRPIGEENLAAFPFESFISGIRWSLLGDADAAKDADHRPFAPPALALVTAGGDEARAVQQAAVEDGERPTAGLAEVVDAAPQELPGVLGIVAAFKPGGTLVALLGADDFAAGLVLPRIQQFLVAVVGADDVEHVGEAVFVVAGDVGAEKGLGDRAGRIDLVADVDKAAEDGQGDVGLGCVVDFISHAVEDDAGVVAVAQDAVAQVGVGPFLEMEVIVMFVFALGPAVEKLVHDEEAHPVAKVEELGGGGIVGGADGVDAEFLEDFETALPHGERHGCSDGSAIVVEADALELEVFSVQPEAGVRLELGAADAEGGGDFVEHSIPGGDAGNERVELRGFEAPERGILDADQLARFGFFFGNERQAGFRTGDFLAGWIDHHRAQDDANRLFRGAGQICGNFDDRDLCSHLRSRDVDAPRRDMHRIGGDEADVTVDSRAGIPTRRGLGRGVGPDDEEIRLAGLEVVGEVVAEADVTIGPAAEVVGVDPDVAVRHDAVELHPHALALGLGGHGDFLAIPGHAGRQPAAGARGRRVLAEVPLDAPVMRHIEFAPGGRVESGFLGTFGVTLEKRPVAVERLDGAGGKRRG